MSAKSQQTKKWTKKSPFSDILYLTNKNLKGFEPTTVYKWLSRDFEVEKSEKREFSRFSLSQQDVIRKLKVYKKFWRTLLICQLLQLWGWQSLLSAKGDSAKPSGVTKLDGNSYFRHFDQIIFWWGHCYDAKTSLGMTTNCGKAEGIEWKDWVLFIMSCYYLLQPI